MYPRTPAAATVSLTIFFLCVALVGCGKNESPSTEGAPVAAEALSTAPANNTQHFDAQAYFDSTCADCHDGSIPKAPHQIKFQIIGRNAIAETLRTGLMKSYAVDLSDAQIDVLADHLGGAIAATVPVVRCDSATVPAVEPALDGWSLSAEGTRFVPPDIAGLAKNQVSSLELEWVFAYPGATRARAQPVPFGDALLVGSQSGAVYALDLASGCAHWQFDAATEVRSALVISRSGERAYFGDIAGNLYAIDPRTGVQIWRNLVDDHADVTITGSPRLHGETVYVPLSSSEWGSAADPGYPCCTFRGGVAAFDVSTGDKRWTTYAIAETPSPTGKRNELGAELHHPAGAPIWNTPTLDVERNQLYVGTGEAYTSPAADTSDSVLAIDLTTGARNWHYQSIAGDAWNMACFIGGGANCPEEDGPDLDIGAPPMLVGEGDQAMVVAGQKSGDVFALNPNTGELIWRTKVGRGGFAGGVHWGMATDGERLYIPNADTIFTGRFTGERKPGLFALDPADGSVSWFTPAPDICAEDTKPACDPGLSAAVTALEGVVFAGAFDGHLRAYDSDSGAILWDFDTNKEFVSVSGEVAHGGSIEADGPVVYRGRVLVNSGYLFGDRMPGNALMVFRSSARTATES